MEQDFNMKHWAKPCPKYNCHKDICKCGLKFVSIPGVLGDDSAGGDIEPKNGTYCNAIVRYEANGNVYIYSKEGIPVLVYGGSASCDCKENLVIDLPNGITEYGRGGAPITYDDVQRAFEEGRSIFLKDDHDGYQNIYTISAFSVDDAIRSIKVERVGIGTDTAGFWQIQSDHSDSWEYIHYFPSVL